MNNLKKIQSLVLKPMFLLIQLYVVQDADSRLAVYYRSLPCVACPS